MPTLMVHLPGLPPVQHVLRDETTTIGRMKSNSIVIEDSSISLMHAKITRKNGDFFLKDLNSTNGTFVNGQPVGEARLCDADRVRFADVTTQFMADAITEASVSPANATFAAAAAVQAQQHHPAPAANAAVAAPMMAAQFAAAAKAPRTPFNEPPPSALPGRSVSQSATSPAPSMSISKLSPSRSADSSPINWSRLISWISASAGAVAAISVLGLVGWRLTHLQDDKADHASSTAVPASVAEAPKPAPASLARTSEQTPSRTEATATPIAEPKLTDNPLELAIFLKSQDVNLRRRAAKAFHGLGGEAAQAATTLRESLADSDEEVQMWAALALVNCQQYDKRAVPILIRALQNDNSVLRQVACLSLGLVPYEEAEKDIVVPALAEIAGRDTDEDVRKAAKSALNIIAPDLYGRPLSSKP